jgi:hypothetical protein
MSIEKMGIDTGWQSGIAHTVSREWANPGWILPAKGVPINAHNKPFSEYNPENGTKNGHHWRDTPNKEHASRLFHIDTNYWKTRWHQGMATAEGDPECVTLPTGIEDNNEQQISHFRAENPIETFGQGRTVFVFQHPPNKPDNHWLDVFVGCMALASRLGISTGSGDQPRRRKGSKKLTRKQIEDYNNRVRNRRFRR